MNIKLNNLISFLNKIVNLYILFLIISKLKPNFNKLPKECKRFRDLQKHAQNPPHANDVSFYVFLFLK